MASSAIPLMQLVDFALCTPEVGTVNFNILHTALAVIIEKVGLHNVNIQYKGADATKFENFKSFVGDSNIARLPEFDIIMPSISDDKEDGDEGTEETDLLTGPTSNKVAKSASKKESEEVIEHESGAIQSGELVDRISAMENTVENLSVTIENLKNEFQNIQSQLVDHEVNAIPDAAQSEEPAMQEGKSVRWQMNDNSQAGEFVQLKTTIEQLSEKVQSMSEAAHLHEAVKSVPEIQELISKTNEIMKILHMFREGDSLSESEKKNNVLHRLHTIDTLVHGHDKQLITLTEYIHKSPDILHFEKSELREMTLQAVSSKTSPVLSSESVTKLSLANVHSLQKMITSHGEDIIYLTNKVQHLEEEFKCLKKIVNKQLKDQEQKDMEHNSMMEQIQVLRTTKAEKYETEDILAGKADKIQVHTKVSHTSFQNFSEEVKLALSNIFEQMKFHEDTYNMDSNRLFAMMEVKVDRSDMTPIVEYVNENLKQLQEKVKALAALKKLEEAAGAKRKYLKDINCISCNTEVVMKQEMDSETKKPEYPIQPESPNIVHSVYQKQVQQKIDEDGHAVKRYCGGSHTITTPKQRVTRVGHFLDQFGPVITTLSKTALPSSPQSP